MATVSVTAVQAYMAEHDCGMLEAKRALRFRYVRDQIDGFQWSGSRDALSNALRELADLVEGRQ